MIEAIKRVVKRRYTLHRHVGRCWYSNSSLFAVWHERRSSAHRLAPLAGASYWGRSAYGGAPDQIIHREFGSDLLAGISIVTSVFLGEYLAGSLVVLMLSGGEALETYAVRSASRALEALARRMPSIAHRRESGKLVDVDLNTVRINDELEVFPHEICPVDGTVFKAIARWTNRI